MKKSLILLSCMLICSIGVFSQTKKTTAKRTVGTTKVKPVLYDENIDMFDADCYYNPAKYTHEIIKNAEKMTQIYSGTSVSFIFSSFVHPEENISSSEYEKMTKDEYKTFYYAYLRNYIATCKLPTGIFWENLRKAGLQKFDFDLEMDNLDAQFKTNPAAYKESKYAKYCPEVADILAEGGKKMFDEWKKLSQEQAQNNSDPERILKEFREQANSKDWEKYARKELAGTKWNSCMIDLRNNGTIYKTIDNSAIQQAFHKLFVRIDYY